MMDAQTMSDERARTDRGRFDREVTDAALIEAVADLDGAGTTTIAETVGLSRDACRRRLDQLAAEGRLTRLGESAYVWIVADADRA